MDMPMLEKSFLDNLEAHIEVFKNIKEHQEDLIQLSRICHEKIGSGGKVVFLGNGGSAADAQHLAAEFVVRFKKERGPLAALALTTDTSVLTAHSNDYDFSTVFSRQVEALCNENDVVIGLTTSGNSPNVIEALKVANRKSICSVAFTGRDGGKVKDVADLSIIVNHNETARIQEAHMFMGHWLCETFDIY